MSSQSENDTSSCSEAPSPRSYMSHGSPLQLVPQLNNCTIGLQCAQEPYLRMIEQPQNCFRFRYMSEMVGTHGCLLGASASETRSKTHPTVELVNFKGEAIIRCQLAQAKRDGEHPHRLQEEEEDREVSYRVPEQNSYTVGFAGMGIIHTAKKDVPRVMFCKKYNRDPNPNSPQDKQLLAEIQNDAKSINLNIVCLQFTAYDAATNQMICNPLLSDPIHNMKSAATNDLKICRSSRISGKPAGGEDTIILVEKVNKKNINVRFFELDEFNKRVWTEKAHFTHGDVHHQYAISFRTPAYRNPNTAEDVRVFVELHRDSDGRTSAPLEFKYVAEPINRLKRRKPNSSYSSISSSYGSPGCHLPDPSLLDQPSTIEIGHHVMPVALPQVPMHHSPSLNTFGPNPDGSFLNGQMASSIQELDLNSEEFNRITQPNGDVDLNDIGKICNSAHWPDDLLTRQDTDLAIDALPSHITAATSESSRQVPAEGINHRFKLPSDVMELMRAKNAAMQYSRSLDENTFDEYSFMATNADGIENSFMNFLQGSPVDYRLVPDSGRPKVQSESKPGPSNSVPEQNDTANTADTKPKTEYPAFFKKEDGMEVKELLKELVEMMRGRNGCKNPEIRTKLERLFDIRLSNGDTFLHMTLLSNPSSFEYIVRLVHSARMQHLLESANYRQQTVLHLAVAHDAPRLVALLVAKGCNPMAKDLEELSAVHYAVKYQCCLDVLLDAARRYNAPCDLNHSNGEKQTALHLAAVSGSSSAVRLLLQYGASYTVRDAEGRTPLHLAAYDDKLEVAQELLAHIPASDVDITDGRGNTALQIVCGGSVRKNTKQIAELLLKKKADPLKHEEYNESAWQLVRHKPELRALVSGLAGLALDYDDDVKSEPEQEDDYESADEYEETGLAELSAYSRELAGILDARGSWRALAVRVRLDGLAAWFGAQPSPAHTLLNHLKESRSDIGSKSLMLILEDMGEVEAASIIRKHI